MHVIFITVLNDLLLLATQVSLLRVKSHYLSKSLIVTLTLTIRTLLNLCHSFPVEPLQPYMEYLCYKFLKCSMNHPMSLMTIYGEPVIEGRIFLLYYRSTRMDFT